MKQVSLGKQKWFLTAALFTVLAGNYAFQTSSKNSGAFEMSSVSDESDTQKRENDRDKEMARLLGLQKTESKKTQAASVESGACTSGDCKTSVGSTVLLKLEDYNKLIARVAELEKAKTADAAKPSEDKKEDAAKPETRAEKRERLAEEKRTKLKDKQDELVAKFDDKMEDVKDKCDKDLQCLTSEFTNVLAKFDGKNSVPAAIVNKQFKSLIAGPLSRSLYNDSGDQQASIEAMQALLSDIPSQYSGIKQITIDTVRLQALTLASRVSQGYKSAEALSKQNNPQAYFQQMNQTREEQQTLSAQASTYTAAIEQTLRETGDQSTFGYYQRSYLPNMQKIMNSMMLPATNEVQTLNVQAAESNNNRNSRNGEVTAQTQNQQPVNNQPIPWNLSNSNNGVQQGQPSTNTRGGRGSY
jgi:hypothetical protein